MLIWSFVSLICRSQSLNIEARGKSFLPYNVKFGFIRFFVLHMTCTSDPSNLLLVTSPL